LNRFSTVLKSRFWKAFLRVGEVSLVGENEMKLDNRFTAVFLVAGLLLGLAAPAAAQDNTSTEIDAEAETDADSTIMETLKSIQEQLADIQNRLTSLENKVDSIEANMSANAEAEVSNSSEGQGPPEQAQNDGNDAGSEVSEEAKEGDQGGIFAAIGNFLSGNGNEEAADAVNNSENEEETENEEEVEGEAEAEGEIQISIAEEVEANSEVTVKAANN
jgi:TolA-binding protein